MEGSKSKKDAENRPKGYYTLIKSQFAYVPYPEVDENPNKQHDEPKVIVLPKQLEELPKPLEFPTENHRWNTNEEIAGLLISFDRHAQWQSSEVKQRPTSGSMVLYNRAQVKYRNDGYFWKKRRDGKTTREDHMKLKVQGIECIYGKYSHSAILPTFHRRCYWLLQNPDVVLVHYLNVPYTDDNKVALTTLSAAEKKKWTREELVGQLRPMISTSKMSDFQKLPAAEQIMEEKVEHIVNHLLQQQPGDAMGNDVQDAGKKKKGLPLLQAAPRVMPQGAALPGQAVLLPGAVNNTNQMSATPFILNLSQFQGSNDLIILSGQNAARISIFSNGQNVQGGATAAQGVAPKIVNVGQVSPVVGVEDMPDSSVCDTTLTSSVFNSTPTSDPASSTFHAYTTLPPGVATVCSSFTTSTPVMSYTAASDGSIVSLSSLPTACMSVAPDQLPGIKESVYSPAPFMTDAQNENKLHMNLVNFNPNQVKSENIDVPGLHLTQEEIQKTLAANMPSESSEEQITQSAADMTDMQQNVSTPTSADLNFDAFDLLDLNDLGEFDSLNADLMITESCEKDKLGLNATLGHDPDLNENSSVGEEGKTGQADVSDYSPDWSYPEGGTKVLITGPWYDSSASYGCTFDGVLVSAQFIQSGVLRCVCPAHGPGFVTFQVTSESYAISKDCAFEYRVRSPSQAVDGLGEDTRWLINEDKQFKLALLERMEGLEKRLVKGPASFRTASAINTTKLLVKSCDIFEERMIDYCEACSRQAWISEPIVPLPNSYKGMTLLHLAAALGYSRLIKTLIQWRTEKSCMILEYEVDALSLDDCSCTPFLWACALNRLDAAVVLYQWNQSAVNVCTREGLLPLILAREKGHVSLVDHIDQLENLREYNSSQNIISFLESFNCSTLSEDSMTLSQPLTSTPERSQASFKTSSKFSSTLSVEGQSTLTVETPPYSTSPKPSPKLKPASKSSKRSERLRKRLSVEILPSKGSPQDSPTNPAPVAVTVDLGKKSLRSVNSDPHLAALTSDENPMMSGDLASPVIFMQTEPQQLASKDSDKPVAMDTDEVSETRSSSPFIDVERVSSDEEDTTTEVTPKIKTESSSSQNQMITLAKQIIAAMPERIKLSPSRSDDSGIVRDRSNSYGSFSSTSTTPPCMEGEGFGAFDEYRYPDYGTPASSLSPESSCLQSPLSFTLDSPPPTMSDFKEYFNAPSTFMEKDFSQLTLSDQEQRHLYEAARIIQDVYRKYKDRQQQQQQRRKEISAAVLIQSYYRRYKQYAYYKKMCQAAVLIQSQFRSYQVQKRFKRSRDAATVIQNQYRAYKEHERFKKSRDAAKIIQQRFRSHYQRSQGGEKSRKGHPLTRQSSHGDLWDMMHTVRFREGGKLRDRQKRQNSQ
ncbi:calmodulin-binding transcription activator 2-like isoform X4 [Lineus longissimus]|uniref:calmodulin-binding transcription activator 2-like isoform X4 n=1 Tax=Lineus longissimus TaxID=88925 RepID=UPI00315DA9AF